ncbi:hypothetical protein D9615_006417 [Tricholomella constricta]|uniref:DNA topoisomerase 2 n=1 Tax=Tricholomella constricta TaxID=117010 RepID=A0A8H5H5L9_9AGAR|nr:hypothetical protein D9615_006417 [Tricholomella constricta]
MSSEDIAEEIRTSFPGTEEVIVQYLAGYLVDDAGEEEDVLQVAHHILSSLAGDREDVLEKLMLKLGDLLEEQLRIRLKNRSGPKLMKLDKVMDMSKAQISSTIALSEGVDLESINKGKASRVDVKKLEKQEAKLKAKIEKRSRRDLYEGSKLLDAHRKQQTYEEMFMKINPLEASASAKQKSKDIHLPSIDVSFASNRILSGATLTLAHGRRYGLIGRNGIGKSTLLRHIAMREVPIPAHISILFVEQEIIGDDTPAIESVLKADVWRDHLLKEEASLNTKLAELEAEGDDKRFEDAREELSMRLAETHARLSDMDAASGPARAAALLAGLGFDESDQHRPTKSFSGGWRMRLALARALFVKPALLLLDEPSNHIDLNALAWLEDYLQTWPGTLLVVSHDRAFLDAIATDIVHQHSGRLDYYKGNFTQFYSTKSERDRNLRKEYDAQMEYRKHLQAFIDRWRYNANRAAQAQMKIKVLEKLPDLEPPEQVETEQFKFPETEKISPPLLQMSEVTFGYTPDKLILKDVNIDVGLDSRIAMVGANGAGKSTLIKILTGDLTPMAGHVTRNGRLRVGYFAQHHVDSLNPTMTPVQFLASKFPGKSEQDYRGHLGNFQISGMTGMQLIGTLSGGQKSRVAFAVLSLQQPHILLLDEPTNHLDIEGLDALMSALQKWNGGVIIISHDERFITTVAKELWVCGDGTVTKFKGDVQAYKASFVPLDVRPIVSDFPNLEFDRQQHQSETIRGSLSSLEMSSSEGENFDLQNVSGSESDDYAPVKKATKAAAKPKAEPKAAKLSVKPKSTTTKAAKLKAAGKKKVLVDHDDNGDDNALEADDASGDEVASLPVKSEPAQPRKKKTASEMYTKLSQLEHILVRPDSYIGSVETITQAMWTYDSANKRMVHRDVKYVPGFFKIVDEILVNAADNKINDSSMDTLKVNINIEDCTISVYNNGRGIPIEMHSTEKMYIPELIFGHLLSSSNYDDDEKKLTGGRNGYGAKLANIYSHEFTVETADKNTLQKYKQTWTDNMSVCGKAKITKNAKGEEWTRVTFRPDLKRFGMDSIDEDTASLLRKRVFDMAGTVKDVKVFLNDERLKIKNFKQYVDMYIQSAQAEAAEASGGAAVAKPTVIYEQIGPRWEIAFAVSEGNFQYVSFANSISTTKGGTHVTYISDQIAKSLVTAISKKNKAATVKPAQIKNHMWIFVNALIENPTFDSQTKETLTLPASKFGTKPQPSEDFLKKVQKSAIIDNILNWAKFKADQQIKKTDGSKRTRLTGLTKLADANNAGTRHAKDCTLILTEGDSAKALAVAGLGVVGRDNFGVFPLRGKLLNVREAKHDQIMKNEEIQNIKKIMGLQHNKDYSDTSSLRYGRLMIMTDQDHDGSHIKGLLINFLDHFYPSLLKLPEFLVEFVTPIVRVTKGKDRIDFFTIPEYEQWQQDMPNSHKWDSKYYKGLGTSTDADARDYFSHMKKHMIPFAPTQDGDKELIDLAFSKKKADDRKEWLRQFTPGTFLDHRLEEIPFSDFINKELILFSMADNIRSIPCVSDGLKPGQRKVVWACFKRKTKKEIKVAQLVGYISEQAAYHHGEVSLGQTIVNLAQDYVGSNNISLLAPKGQYGTREQGGKNHASPRYIFTEPTTISRAIFNAADDALLTVQKDDGNVIEPEWYMPIVPLILINGAEGIGTGWSTNIPCYNPAQIVANLRRLMDGEELVPMTPWWRGFNGEIKMVGHQKYEVTGIVRKINDTTVEITELPIHVWTEKYKEFLETLIVGEKGNEGGVKDYKEHHDNRNVHFVVTMTAKELEKAEEQGLLEYFKLTGKLSTSNMMCFDFEGKIRKYESPEEIIESFYPVRLAYYQKRKDFLANELQTAFEKMTNQARFIQMIVDKQLVVSNRKKADIVLDLRKHEFRPFPKVASAKKANETIEAEDDEDDSDNAEAADGKGKAGDTSDYDYLLGMAIWSLTREKIAKLRLQAEEKEKELLVLLEKTPKSMWNADLDVFLQEWEADCKTWTLAAELDANGKKIKRKQTTLKTRKSIGGARKDSDDDDFKPIKAPARKKAGETARPKSTVKKPIKDEDVDMDAAEKSKPRPAAPQKRKVSGKKVTKDESDDDDDIIEVAHKPAARKRIAAKPTAIPSDSEDEVTVLPSKGKAKAKEAPKQTFDDDDHSDDGFLKIPVAGGSKGKGKASDTTKRKRWSHFEAIHVCAFMLTINRSPALSEDSDDDLYIKPAAKKKKVTDFFEKAAPKTTEPVAPTARKLSKSMKPASPPKPKPKAKAKVVSDSDHDDDLMNYDELPVPKKAAPAPARAARAAPKKYVEILSDDDDDGNEDASMFEDDD